MFDNLEENVKSPDNINDFEKIDEQNDENKIEESELFINEDLEKTIKESEGKDN